MNQNISHLNVQNNGSIVKEMKQIPNEGDQIIFSRIRNKNKYQTKILNHVHVTASCNITTYLW